MTILALEFSSPIRSVALLEHATGMPRIHAAVASDEESVPRTTTTFALVDRVLRSAGLLRTQVTVVAVGLGPGSYTGIRAAISVAQGWEASGRVTVAGISGLEALARQASLAGWEGRVTFAFDAQRGETCAVRYELRPGHWTQVEPLQVMAVEMLRSRLESGEKVAGPDLGRLLPEATVLYPRAEDIAELANQSTARSQGGDLAPVYLRQAEFRKAPLPSTTLPPPR
jgi:tRNA threonylcarbamoyladenosine biosynthesis protein TsaB